MNCYVKMDPNIIFAGKETELVKMPVVIRVTEFDEKAEAKFTEAMCLAHTREQPVIPIVINSYGGYVYCLMAMLSQIANSKIPVATIVEGKAMSAGAILFSAGTKGMRYMAKNSTLLLHEVSGGTFGKTSDIKVSSDEMERLNKILFTILAKNCDKPSNFFLDEIQKRKNADWYLTPTQAKKLKLADNISVPELVVETKVTYNFK